MPMTTDFRGKLAMLTYNWESWKVAEYFFYFKVKLLLSTAQNPCNKYKHQTNATLSAQSRNSWIHSGTA